MGIVVQKFGGTSVSTPENREHCMRHIKRAVYDGNGVVVVVSAMGRLGDPYATDTLLALIGEDGIISKREKDMLLSTGEMLTASIFSSMLNKENIKNVVLTGGQSGIVTDDNFGSALIVEVHPHRIEEELSKGNVVVVPGFQGQTKSGEITTLGRGGSDTTAAALAGGLKAEVCDIYTDVEFMMTADPRIVERPFPLKNISYEEVSQLAISGAKVIHPRAVDFAMRYEVPLRIRSTFSDNEGTMVKRFGFQKGELNPKEKLIAGIVSNHSFVHFEIKKGNADENSDLFSYLNEKNISIDFINVTNTKAFFTVSHEDAEILSEFLDEQGIRYIMRNDYSKIAIVGSAINGYPGVMSEIINTLSYKGIEVYQTADSNTTIWVLIKKQKEKEAVCALHNNFFESQI